MLYSFMITYNLKGIRSFYSGLFRMILHFTCVTLVVSLYGEIYFSVQVYFEAFLSPLPPLHCGCAFRKIITFQQPFLTIIGLQYTQVYL
jgi:hypothetical protein